MLTLFLLLLPFASEFSGSVAFSLLLGVNLPLGQWLLLNRLVLIHLLQLLL